VGRNSEAAQERQAGVVQEIWGIGVGEPLYLSELPCPAEVTACNKEEKTFPIMCRKRREENNVL
jgi:hypothetical protein